MPDSIGRYTLSEMRERVWRRLDSYRPSAIATDGTVDPLTVTYTVDPLYPEIAVNHAINKALTAQYIDLISSGSAIFGDEEEINVVTDISEYSLPVDCFQLRGLWWKDPDDTRTVIPFNDRIFMHQVESADLTGMTIYNGAPTYRRQLNFFVLNEVPKRDNPGGILARYIKWVNWLSLDDQVIETEYAQLLQECVILAAALDLARSNAQLDVPEWDQELSMWRERILVTARNSTTPPFMVFYVEHPIKARR